MSAIVAAVARLVLLPIFMVAAALLVRGATATGDGFSAGVVAASGLLLQYVVFGHREVGRRTRIAPAGPFLAFGGLAVMLGVVFAGPVRGKPLLTHLPEAGAHVDKLGRLDLHTGVLYDAGIALLVFGVLVGVLEAFAAAADAAAERS